MDEGVLDFTAHVSPLRSEHDLLVGREYTAMGLGFWDGVAWVEIATEGGFLMSIPLTEFEIVEGSASAFWTARVDRDGTVRLWPPTFYEGTYHSDLADLEPGAVSDFARVRAMIESEDRRRSRNLSM